MSNLGRICFAGLVVSGLASTAQAISLDFNDPITTIDSTNATYGNIVEQSVILFRNVAVQGGVTVDARVTATAKANTEFGGGTASGSSTGANSGFITDYKSTNGSTEPNDDLGFLFAGLGQAGDIAGIEFVFELFDGTGAKTGTFTDQVIAEALEIMIYDVDGEASQGEAFSAFKSDGLVSYRLSSTNSMSVTDNNDSLYFQGGGTNVSESDASGAAILRYEYTSVFTLDFVAEKFGGSERNAVFTALDGDLSLADLNDFGATTNFPAITTTVPTALDGPPAAWRTRCSCAAAASLQGLTSSLTRACGSLQARDMPGSCPSW